MRSTAFNRTNFGVNGTVGNANFGRHGTAIRTSHHHDGCAAEFLRALRHIS
jgi:hypothetical protein